MTDAAPPTWRGIATNAIIVFVVALVGCAAAFTLWLSELNASQVAILGSGDRLSIMVTDGSARLVIATGDDPIGFENALTHVRPIFARRVDVALIAGAGDSLLVPLAAAGDPHTRLSSAMAPLPPSPESETLRGLRVQSGPRRIRLGPSLTVTVETQYPFGADPAAEFPAWRATIERGETRVVVLSDGEAAALFPPSEPASVLVVSGDDPTSGWPLSPAPAVVVNATAIEGPDLRSAFAGSPRPPAWGFRVFPGEALKIRFISGGVELPSESAHALG